jgi:hypothetical protein
MWLCLGIAYGSTPYAVRGVFFVGFLYKALGALFGALLFSIVFFLFLDWFVWHLISSPAREKTIIHDGALRSVGATRFTPLMLLLRLSL